MPLKLERSPGEEEEPRAARDGCLCCPGGVSRMSVECMAWRRVMLGNHGRVKYSAAGRYPVDKKFPCESCGRVEEHRH